MKHMNKYSAAALALLTAFSLCACNSNTGAAAEAGNDAAQEERVTLYQPDGRKDWDQGSPDSGNSEKSGTVEAPEIEAVTTVTGNFTITTEDGAVTENGNTYTITSAGTYVLSGVLSDGQVIVAAGEEDEVELDLNGVSITCSYDSPIWIQSAGEAKIKAMENTENSVNDTRALQTDDNDTAGSAAIYAECDLDIVGKGTLTVIASYNNGIHTKDDLEIKNLTLNVSAPNKALKGNDSVTIESGSLRIVSTNGDGIKTKNSDVSSKGNQRGIVTILDGTVEIYAGVDGIDAAYDVIISGGSVTVKAGDDGIHAENTVQTDGGSVSVVDSHEGIEGHAVTINDGEIHVYATDDGINATSSANNRFDGLVTVNGGKVYVEVSGRDVDGIDSNGSYVQNGGFVVVSNPNANAGGMAGALDVENTVTVNDGVILALGGGQGQMPGGQGGFGGQGQMPGGQGGFGGQGQMPGGQGGFGGQGQMPGGQGGFGGQGQMPGGQGDFNPGGTSDTGTDDTAVISLGYGNDSLIEERGGFGGKGGGFGGMGGMTGSAMPDGAVTYTGSLSAGTHTFTYGDISESFTLKNAVSGGWIYAAGISSDNYTLE
ncbi:MAG: carbohydrate-binding domain-containing protein [Lachnospiraceae bacterium]|nr:carbohydrate-binding domain-containing protein [Lachnospiraceae bacterium]